MPPLITVIVLYYNTYDLTKRCLRSIFDSSYPNKRVVLVDNNSLIEPASLLLDQFAVDHYHRLPTNLGFSAGVNSGIEYALKNLNSDYIAIVNSDLRLEKDCLLNSVTQLENLRQYLPIAALTGKIMFDHPRSNLIWQAGGIIDNFRASGVPFGFKQPDSEIYCRGDLTGWASGAYSVFPSYIFEQYGLFDESYFFGQEEWDFSTRLLRAKKFIYYSPESLSWHKVGGSYKGHHPVLNTYNGYLNKVIYARRWIRLFPFWWILFAVRTLLFLPSILAVNCFHITDILPQTKAVILSLLNSLYIKKVTGSHLASMAKLIGTSHSWMKLWSINPSN